MRHLHIDIETYSETDITNCGVYKYIEDPKFEILLIAYAVGHNKPTIIDLARGESDAEFREMLFDPDYVLAAHNATFERLALSKHYGAAIPIERWYCTMALAARSGLPLALGDVANALGFDLGKISTGREMIRYYCVPQAPTKSNGMRTRNFPEHSPNTKAKQWDWETFKSYCVRDVEVEQEIYHTLAHANPATPMEREVYILDQKINDRGVALDMDFINGAVAIDEEVKEAYMQELRETTGLDNPKSGAQMKRWISEEWGHPVTGLTKADRPILMHEAKREGRTKIVEVLGVFNQLQKTSTAKYTKMQAVACRDKRGRGFIQYYGASRTGRFAGRLVQVQNLPQNHLDERVMDIAREVVRDRDTESMQMQFASVTDALSQMIRTAFVPSEDKIFAVADYAQIEARVIAWLAGEQWALETFYRGEDIYIAAASMMFGIPKDQIDKHSEERKKGKVGTLACGYQGGSGAIKAFSKPSAFLDVKAIEKRLGAEHPELSYRVFKTILDAEIDRLFDIEASKVVRDWRKASPSIVNMWYDIDDKFSKALDAGEPQVFKIRGRAGTPTNQRLVIRKEHKSLTIELPSKRKLFYYDPRFGTNQYGNRCVQYWGMNQTTRQWRLEDTYGGKLVENITQAVARDLLCEVLVRVDPMYPIVMTVHDELIAEVPRATAERDFNHIIEIMAEPIDWARGLPTQGAGFLTEYYKKD